MIYRNPYDRLLALVDMTPGAARTLQEAHRAGMDGRAREAWLWCAIAADRVAIEHPDDIPDPILLRDLFAKLFLADPGDAA